MGMKILYDPDVCAFACVLYDPNGYTVTCGGEHGEGDGCDEKSGDAGQEGHHGPEVGVPLQELQLLHFPKKKISIIK
jgi:hypothetical protein